MTAGGSSASSTAGSDSLLPYPPGFDVAALLLKKKAEAGGNQLPYQPRFTIMDLPAAPEQDQEETKPDVSSLMVTSLPSTSLNKKERTMKEVNPHCLNSVVN